MWSVEVGPCAGLFQTVFARCMPLKGSKQPSAGEASRVADTGRLLGPYRAPGPAVMA